MTKRVSVQKRLFTLIVQDCTKIVRLYSSQTEENKDCEAHRCVDFFHSGPLCLISKLEVHKIGHVRRLKKHH